MAIYMHIYIYIYIYILNTVICNRTKKNAATRRNAFFCDAAQCFDTSTKKNTVGTHNIPFAASKIVFVFIVYVLTMCLCAEVLTHYIASQKSALRRVAARFKLIFQGSNVHIYIHTYIHTLHTYIRTSMHHIKYVTYIVTLHPHYIQT